MTRTTTPAARRSHIIAAGKAIVLMPAALRAEAATAYAAERNLTTEEVALLNSTITAPRPNPRAANRAKLEAAGLGLRGRLTF